MPTNRPLSLVQKLKQTSVQQFIEEHLWQSSNLAPYVVELDPTTACNLACHDCISANLLNQGGIDSQRLVKLAEEFIENGVKAVVLIGGGEPMAHPKFGELCDIFSDNDIHVGVTTNGTLMQRYMPQCCEKTKWLRVSVDAGTPEIFAEYRPHASGISQFDLVIDNMRTMAKQKTGLLGYSFLILSKEVDGELRTNAVDIGVACALAKEIGCDYFEVKPAFDLAHFLQPQTNELEDIVSTQLYAARQLADDQFRVIAPFTLDEAIAGKTTQQKAYSRCLTAQMRTLITPSGAYVCPYHRGNPAMRIGDVNKMSFTEIWQGKQRQRVMAGLSPDKHCQFHCIRHESNQLLEEQSKGKKIEMIEDFDRFL